MTFDDDGEDRVTFRLGELLIERLDQDVEAGRFANRSDGLRYIIRSYYFNDNFSDDVEPEGENRGGWNRGKPRGPAKIGGGSP